MNAPPPTAATPPRRPALTYYDPSKIEITIGGTRYAVGPNGVLRVAR